VVFIFYNFDSVWKNRKAIASRPDLVNSVAQWATPTRNGLKPAPAPLISGMGTGVSRTLRSHRTGKPSAVQHRRA
jgi:hypothetical protein